MLRATAFRHPLAGLLALPIVATVLWSERVAADPAQDCQAHENVDQRIAICGELIKKDPKNAAAYFGLGGAKFMKGDFEGAIADLTQSFKLEPRAPGPLLVRSQVHQRLGKAELELADLNAAIKAAPKDYNARLMRGVAYMNRSKYEQAISDLSAAQRIDAKNPTAYVFRIPLLLNASRFKEAVTDCETLKSGEAATQAPLFQCALAYDKAGNRPRAIALYKRVPAADANHAKAKEALTRLKAE